MVKRVFPALVKHRPRGQPIRVWVPGCSSGEEAYSIAMSLVEYLGESAPDYPIQIFGTDISETAIARARAGIYRRNIALDVPPERLRRFFTVADAESYRIANSVRDVCVFARQDLSADPPFSKLDLISCQNLLIYFGSELQQRVIQIFHYALQPRGFLLLSPAESIGGFSELFTQVGRKQRIYARTWRPGKPEMPFTPRAFAEEPMFTPPAESPAAGPRLWKTEKVAEQGPIKSRRQRGVTQPAEMKRLRQELATVQESFAAAIEEQEATKEELKSANEEIQSSNEELQSTNEELETAKEELESTNEELETVNEELRHANVESTRVNTDLINLLASVQIPIVMVDSNLTIRRFTPSAQKYFSLILTDIGRKLSDIKVNFDIVELDKMIQDVIDTLHYRESEVRDRTGHWYLLRVRPYRTTDNRIDGAALALFDIDELKRSLEQISDLMWSPFLALDHELRVVRANEAFYEMFQVPRKETEGRFILRTGQRPMGHPAAARSA
jgi:two-component system CheB/CheR fusion protein